MDSRIEFENLMSDWIAVDGRPAFDEAKGLYSDIQWQKAWVVFRRIKNANIDALTRFGGKEKVKASSKKQGIDDVYCWETQKWYAKEYWAVKMSKLYTGVTLRELAIQAKI